MRIGHIVFYILTVQACICIVGCATPDPTRGWSGHNANLDPPNQTNLYSGSIYYIDKAILDDYPKYIEQLETKYPHLYLSEVDFYEDGAGQHAVKLTVETGLRDYKEFYIMYDKSNLRTKIIEGTSWHQFHM